MQHPASLALLGAACAFSTASAAGSLPRGVGPEFASFYKSKETFQCISNQAIKLSASQVNDNSCDCPDGSDEPGTAACAYLDPLSPPQPLSGSTTGTSNTSNALPGFWCENKGHIGTYVPFLYVNDGVCDYELCCDGSEEFGGKIKCENKCKEIGKEYRRLEQEKRKKMEIAGKKRKGMTDESALLKEQTQKELTELKAIVDKLEKEKAELERKKLEVEREERGKVVKAEGEGGKLGVLVSVAKARVTELRNTLTKVVDQKEDLENRIMELEEILRNFKQDYNPNFNDEGVKTAVKAWEDYASRDPTPEEISPNEIDEILKEDGEEKGVNWKEFEEGDDDTGILFSFEAYLPGFVRDLVHDHLRSLRVWFIENGILADSGKGKESQLVKAAREAVETVNRDLNNKKRELEKTEKDLGTDYGPEDIFRALKGKCVSTDAGEYTYELCWWGNTSQKSKKGHGNTNMGNFDRLERHYADEEERLDGKSLGQGLRMVLKYEDGQGCWNGPKRRTDVWLGCAETEELWRVSESEKCVYKMEVGTPAACEVEENVQEPRGKDEL